MFRAHQRDDKYLIPVPPNFRFFGSNFLARGNPKGSYVVEKESNEDYVICI